MWIDTLKTVDVIDVTHMPRSEKELLARCYLNEMLEQITLAWFSGRTTDDHLIHLLANAQDFAASELPNLQAN